MHFCWVCSGRIEFFLDQHFFILFMKSLGGGEGFVWPVCCFRRGKRAAHLFILVDPVTETDRQADARSGGNDDDRTLYAHFVHGLIRAWPSCCS